MEDNKEEKKEEFKEVAIQNNENNGPIYQRERSKSMNEKVVVGPMYSISSFKEWSLSRMKCTKQFLKETFIYSSKTIDPELQFRISDLLETKQQYIKLINSAQLFLNNLKMTNQTQKEFSDLLNEFSQKSQPLYEPFIANAETQKTCFKNSNKFEDVLQLFICNLTTLAEKTMEDTILNVKQYEMARLEYDAYRNEYENFKQTPNMDANKLKDAELKSQEQLVRFEQVKADLDTKLKLFEENKLKVLHRNLVVIFESYSNVMHNNQAIFEEISSKYKFNSFSGNASFLNL